MTINLLSPTEVTQHMGETVNVEGHHIAVHEETTVEDIKEAVGAADNDVATFTDEDDEIVALGDHDNIQRNVPDGAVISFQPGDGTVFGQLTH